MKETLMRMGKGEDPEKTTVKEAVPLLRRQ
jgi:hypothetical protein